MIEIVTVRVLRGVSTRHTIAVVRTMIMRTI